MEITVDRRVSSRGTVRRWGLEVEKSSRIRLIQQIRDGLSELPREDVDLVLQEYGFGVAPDDEPLSLMLQRVGDDQSLLALGRHLAVPAAEDVTAGLPVTGTSRGSEPGRLFLFASHLSTERRFVGEVSSALNEYGITMFVAHDSIAIDAVWEPEIADALRQCHGAVAFIHQGLHSSYYCMQEVGWLLGRGVPIARLIFDEDPKGLLGSKQGIRARAMSAQEVAVKLLNYVTGKPELEAVLVTSLTHAMRESTAFRITDSVWLRLRTHSELTLQQATTLLEAAEEQSQVYRAKCGGPGGRPYRSEIADFLDAQPSAVALASRIALIRKYRDSDVAISQHHIIDSADE